MRVLLPAILLLLFFCACQSEPSPEAAATESSASASPAVNTSLSPADVQRYQELLAAREEVYPLTCNPEAGKVNPADEAPRDTAFFLFREKLKEVVANKDIFGLLPHVSDDIKSSFGGEDGLQDFIRTWELDSPDKIPQSELWNELGRLLELGGTFERYREETAFWAPYSFTCWREERDAFEYGAVIGAGVRLRSGPGLNTKVVKTLSYDLVKYLETTPNFETIGGESHPWIKVALVDGTEGFLYGKFYRSPIDFRAGFQRNAAGEWKMMVLVAGD